MPNGLSVGDRPQMPGGFGSMGSEDVKLQYIDDNPDSYANIFSSAKTDVSELDEKRLISALKNLSAYSNLENTLNMDEVLRYFVVHNFVVNGDSYTGNMIHNYYLHEKNGKLGMIPWDYNLAFGAFQGGSADEAVNDSIDKVLSDRPMQAWIFSDERYTDQYHALFQEFITKWFTNEALEKMIADTAEMLRPYVEKDPTKFCTEEEFDTGIETLKQFVRLRAEAVERQINGDLTAVETGDMDLSAMGSMGGGMGRGMPGENKNTSTETFVTDPGKVTPASGATMQVQGVKEGESNEPPGSAFDPSRLGQNKQQMDRRTRGDNNLDPRDSSVPVSPFGSSDQAKWMLVGISFAVLVIGLWIAVKKKY